MEKPFRILVAEDEEILHMVLTRVLERAGYSVTLVSDGSEALRLLKSQPFDLLLSDINLPGLDGAQLLRKMREEKVATPMIAMSGDDADGPNSSLKAAISLGAVGAVIKPFTSDILLAAVGRVLVS